MWISNDENVRYIILVFDVIYDVFASGYGLDVHEYTEPTFTLSSRALSRS